MALVASLVGVTALTLSTVTAATAAGGQTTFVNEGFTTGAVAGYILPSAGAKTNDACLTAPAAGTTSIPVCATSVDSSGQGALRLTGLAGDKEGGVGSMQSIPISKGLDASFNSYQYGNSSAADGIAFYLAVTDPFNPQVPTAIGASGGSLGYSPNAADSAPTVPTSSGLAHGYLGLGLDNYGNFLRAQQNGTGCDTSTNTSTRSPNVSVRGPGNGTTGYCLLPGYDNTLPGSSPLQGTGSTRATAKVPVEVIINPASTSTTSAGAAPLTSVTVGPSSYTVVYLPLGATQQRTVTGSLPKLNTTATSGLFDSSWYSPTTGLPYKLSFGWVASTGGSYDIHEVNLVKAQTLNGPVPVLTAPTSSTALTPQHGSTGTYAVTPTVSSTGGSESESVHVTTTFPTGLTPTAYAGTDYSCSLSGQVQTCAYTGTTSAGSALPELDLPFTASGAAGSTSSISSVVSSTDASALTTTTPVTIAQTSTSTSLALSPATPSYGVAQTLTATVSPSAAGTVAFRDTRTGVVLCAAAPVTDGVATCTTTAGAAGPHTISATYSGDTNDATSTTTTTETVLPLASTITDSVNGASSAGTTYGTVAILAAHGIPADATGTIDFTGADSTVLCTATLPATSCSTAAALAAGSYAVSARYSGDANHTAAATVAASTLTVAKAPSPALSVSVDTSSVPFGSQGTFSTSGLPSGASGTVTYRAADLSLICTATLPATSCASATDLDAGTYAVTATWSGDDDHMGSDSASTSFSVTRAPTAITATVDGGPTDTTIHGTAAHLAKIGRAHV